MPFGTGHKRYTLPYLLLLVRAAVQAVDRAGGVSLVGANQWYCNYRK